jgi:hypothetical protein
MKEKVHFNKLSQWDIKKDDEDWMLRNDFAERDTMPKMSGKKRDDAVNDLETKTSHRINPATGEKEFLLHRGIGEQESWAHDEGSISDKTSWSPYHHVAQKFSNKYNSTDSAKVRKDRAVSAWIPSKHIHSIPIHNLKPDTDAYNYLKDEHEVVVSPHKFNYASPKEKAAAQKNKAPKKI